MPAWRGNTEESRELRRKYMRDYAQRTGCQRKYYSKNKDKINERLKVDRANNPEKWKLRRHRALGYPAPTRPRPAQCECCGKQPKRTLDLDHDHELHVFRGWLCNGCNTAIGKLEDSRAGVLRALIYLEKAYASAPGPENLG